MEMAREMMIWVKLSMVEADDEETVYLEKESVGQEVQAKSGVQQQSVGAEWRERVVEKLRMETSTTEGWAMSLVEMMTVEAEARRTVEMKAGEAVEDEVEDQGGSERHTAGEQQSEETGYEDTGSGSVEGPGSPEQLA